MEGGGFELGGARKQPFRLRKAAQRVKLYLRLLQPLSKAFTTALRPNSQGSWSLFYAEKFNEVAVSANLEGKTEFLFVTEVVEDRSGGWRVRIEQSNGGGWSPVVSDSQ